MRSPRARYIERIRDIGDASDRFIDIAARLQVYRRGKDGKPEKAELLPQVWGGRWDTRARKYVGRASRISEISCHPGQIDLLTFHEQGIGRVLALGAKGGGKTDAIVRRAILNALEIPGGFHGLVAPTAKRLGIVWNKAVSLLRELGWLKSIRWSEGCVEMLNDSRLLFMSSKRQSADLGSPIAGYDLHSCVEDEQQNIDDESLAEVDARGRVAASFCVFSAATNERIPEFQARVLQYRQAPWAKVLRFTAEENPWYSLDRLNQMKAQWSPDEWRRIMESEDVPHERAVYPQFSISENCRPLPDVFHDITRQITKAKFDPNGSGYDYIIGSDFGVLTTCSTWFRVMRDPSGDRLWWAVGEVVTKNNTAAHHVEDCKEWGRKNGMMLHDTRLLFVSMPHVNAGQKGQTEQHDFVQVKKAGMRIVQASAAPISRKHRFSMVNAMACAADGKRRLFVATKSGKLTCPRGVESFGGLLYGPDGNPNAFGKGEHDLTHFTDTFGYALFPWEQFRGTTSIETPALADHRKVRNGRS